ncbi:GDP-mannose mannosyl hydrolase [Halorussus caseinilyticus]|uniref:GDP-mannose mannosyl hydrolase n=1 Tax=Halorussus caseinilyticus TaxID=3034025 RepID=A0ABD5WM78_9EURY|nr:NUDIX domain-containing protein [Halorussus sp. DT72]
MHQRIPDDEWKSIVRNVPIVSVDLVVRHDGGVVLGKRTNEPAKGEWFVPGGRLHKNERLEDAVARIAREELGVEVTIVGRLGAYEHLYDRSEFEGTDGKHYIPVGFVVETDDDELNPDSQHAELEVFRPPFDFEGMHEYVADYLRDAGVE